MRAFIALDVPEEMKQKAEALGNDFRIGGITLVKKEAMRITLQFIGEIDAAQAEKVTYAMKSLKFKPFKVTLSGLSYFTPRMIKVIFVEVSEGAPELKVIYEKLSSALRRYGVSFEREDYVPHFTIARVKWAKEMRKLRDAIEKNSKIELGSFEAKEISLKESDFTPSGPVYRNLYELRFSPAP